MARNTKLTPECQAKIVTAIRGGNYAVVAAQSAGITEATFYNWLQRGKSDGSGIYFEFLESIKEAEAAAELEAVAHVRLAGHETWQAAMTWLERKFPKRWGRYDRTEQIEGVTIRIVDESSDAIPGQYPNDDESEQIEDEEFKHEFEDEQEIETA